MILQAVESRGDWPRYELRPAAQFETKGHGRHGQETREVLTVT